MEVSKDIIENLFLDWRKKDIPKQERAELLKQYRKENNLTQRLFEKVTGISKGTLHDWENPEVRDNRKDNTQVKLQSLLHSLKNMKDIEVELEPTIKKIEKEIYRLKDIINQKKVHS